LGKSHIREARAGDRRDEDETGRLQRTAISCCMTPHPISHLTDR
jgi:hypothetical protein